MEQVSVKLNTVAQSGCLRTVCHRENGISDLTKVFFSKIERAGFFSFFNSY